MAAGRRYASTLLLALVVACSGRADPLRLIADEQPAVRVAGATALGERGGRRAVDALRAHVGDPDPTVRIAVAGALAEAGGEGAATDISRLLSDELPSVRVAAAEALASLPGEASREPLLAGLGDPDSEVRAAVRRGLEALGVDGAAQVAHLAEERRRAAVDTARSGSVGRRVEATRALAECGDAEALAALVDLARDPELEVARLAAAGLGRAGADASWAELAPVLGDERREVLEAALDGLSLAPSIGQDSALRERLCGLLGDPAVGPAAAAVVAAHRVDCPLEGLAGRLDGEDAAARVAAAQVIALVLGGRGGDAPSEGPPEEAALLARAVRALWAEGSFSSLVAVAAVAGPPPEEAAARLLREVEAYRDAAARWVPQPEREGGPPDGGAADEGPITAQGEAAIAELLSRYRPRAPDRVELFPAPSDPDGLASLLLIAAELGVEVPREQLDALAAEAPDPVVRAAAVAARGATVEELDAPLPIVRISAAEALGRLGPDLPPRARARLAAMLPDRDPEIRAAAARALGATRDPAALRPLVAAFERWRDPDVARALGALGEAGAAEPLAVYLRRPVAATDPELVSAMLLSLAEVGGEEQLDAVVPLLDHSDARVRAAAVAAARRIGGERGGALAEERRGDFARVVREAAALPVDP